VFGRKLPGKEFAIGFFCTVPIWVAFGWHGEFAVLLPIYAGVITLNCLVIAFRERDLDLKVDPGAATAWWPTLERDVLWIGWGLVVASVAAACSIEVGSHATGVVSFLSTSAASALFLVILHSRSLYLSAERVRALADLCLLVPVLWITS
jgi:hypothetical protein